MFSGCITQTDFYGPEYNRTPVEEPTNIADHDILFAARSAWGSPVALADWGQRAMPCANPPWSFAVCNTNGQLVGLQLSGVGLSGSLPIDRLSYLQTLDLSNNALIGTIPASWGMVGNFTTLARVLNLSSNVLTGTLPTTFRSFAAAETLDFSYNKLQVWCFNETVSDVWCMWCSASTTVGKRASKLQWVMSRTEASCA